MIWTYDNIQIFANKAKCCQGEKVRELADKAANQGWTSCMTKDMFRLLMLNYQIATLLRYAPEGSIITTEQLAEFTFLIEQAGAGYSLTVDINGVATVTVASYSGESPDNYAGDIAAALTSYFASSTAFKGFTVGYTALTHSITIIAPVGSGASANGTLISFTQNGGAFPIVRGFNDAPFYMIGGVTQVLAGKPCLTDKQAESLYESIEDFCGGCSGCNNDLNYNDIN